MSALPTDYQDDVLDTSVNTKRKFRMTENEDKTISLDDATDYETEGTPFGAADINRTNGAVNRKITVNGVAAKNIDITINGNNLYITTTDQ